ncbi:MAG: DUF1501 domain-containing protein, partial [Planctomycetes bacterium]|nr:DUF1501 domain-containing protein [Planctomycetota bacterium]
MWRDDKVHDSESLQHPVLSRRSLIQAGAVGALGLGMTELASLRALAARAEPGRANRPAESPKRAKAVIFIYAIGGMSQLETFDMKPQAPADIRGEFRPIDTSIPGIAICEHLPMLAQRSRLFSLVRSVSHPHNSHLHGCMVMQSGRTALPAGFKGPSKRTDWPGIAAVAGYATKRRGVLPAAMIVPELTYHNRANLVPGQTAGMMGPRHDPWVVKAAASCLGQGYNTRGACPDCFEFITFKGQHRHQAEPLFATPKLELPAGVDANRFSARLELLAEIDHQRRELDQFAGVAEFDRH